MAEGTIDHIFRSWLPNDSSLLSSTNLASTRSLAGARKQLLTTKSRICCPDIAYHTLVHDCQYCAFPSVLQLLIGMHVHLQRRRLERVTLQKPIEVLNHRKIVIPCIQYRDSKVWRSGRRLLEVWTGFPDVETTHERLGTLRSRALRRTVVHDLGFGCRFFEWNEQQSAVYLF